jgi:hypothetical protein
LIGDVHVAALGVARPRKLRHEFRLVQAADGPAPMQSSTEEGRSGRKAWPVSVG